MSNDPKALEIKVGLFVLIGLIAIAVMAVEFGRLGQGLAKFYDLTVEFPNASGLLKNADIQLAGAVIGHVAEKPAIVPGRIDGVTVPLKIKEDIHLPRGCSFQVGSSGMLGDKYVDITLPGDFDSKAFNPGDPKQALQPGDTVKGAKGGGIEALTKKGEVAMEKLADNLDELKATILKVQTNLLSDGNLDNLKSAFASIKVTGDNFADASKKINDVVVDAQSAVQTAKETMASAKTTMSTANDAANDIRAAISDVRGTVQTAQTILKNVQSGPGTLPMLLGNREVAENLRALISNIRRHGVLFYRDTSRTDTVPVNEADSRAPNRSNNPRTRR